MVKKGGMDGYTHRRYEVEKPEKFRRRDNTDGINNCNIIYPNTDYFLFKVLDISCRTLFYTSIYPINISL